MAGIDIQAQGEELNNMAPSPESSLLVIGIALYLFDSARLIYPSEGILIASNERWRTSLGFDQFQLAGKNVLFFSPIAPGHAAFRAIWFDTTAVDPAALAGVLRDRANSLRVLSWPVTIQLIVMFIVVPVCLFHFPGMPLAVALGFLYANAMGSLCVVAIRRKRFELRWGQVAVIAFECLVCIPLSINLLRKLSFGFSPTRNMIAVSRLLLDDGTYRKAAHALQERIAAALDEEEEGTEDYLELTRLRDSVQVVSA